MIYKTYSHSKEWPCCCDQDMYVHLHDIGPWTSRRMTKSLNESGKCIFHLDSFLRRDIEHTWEEHLVGILGADEVSAEGDDDDNDERECIHNSYRPLSLSLSLSLSQILVITAHIRFQWGSFYMPGEQWLLWFISFRFMCVYTCLCPHVL